MFCVAVQHAAVAAVNDLCCAVVTGSSSDVSGLGLDGSSVDKSRNSFRSVSVSVCVLVCLVSLYGSIVASDIY